MLLSGWLTAADAGTGDKLNVVVTIKPIHSLVAAVMAGVGRPHLLIRNEQSPHGFVTRPSDARMLAEADVVIRVSAEFELFLERALRSSPDRVRVLTLNAVAGLTRHDIRSGSGSGLGAGAGGHLDAHIWLDPVNAKAIVNHVALVLAAEAPADAAKLIANAKALMAKLDALSAELAAALKPLRGRPYVVFHDAYQYLERRYGLAPAGAVALSPGQPPGARAISTLRAKIKSLGVTCLFIEPQFAPKLVGALIEGTRARTGTLDPIGAALPPGPELYFTMMRALAAGLRACLLG